MEPTKVIYDENHKNLLNLPDEYNNIYKLAGGLNYITNVEIYFDPADLHSIETLDNYALRFRTIDGVALGDGGEYTNYAKRWNNKIESFWSVASGVEAIERNSPEISFNLKRKKIALYNMGTTPRFILKVLKEIEDIGECVVYKGDIKNVGKTIKKIQNKYTHIAIIGSNEEKGGDIIIKSISDGETFVIKSPNNKMKGLTDER